MTIKRFALPFLAAALCGLAASPAHAVWFAGESLDGPTPDITEVGNADLARDGGGGVAYLKREGGLPRVYASQFFEGRFFPPQRIDAGQSSASSQPRIAASDEGRLTVVWVNGGSLYGATQDDKRAQFSAPTRIFEGSPADPVADPTVDMSVHGVGYVAFSAAGQRRDVRAARLAARGGSWTVLDGVFDNDPGADAGAGRNRPTVAVSADGSALVGWGEAGGVLVRRAGRARPSGTAIAATDADLAGAVPGAGDQVDVALANDSSYGWVALRQTFTGEGGPASRLVARRLVGSNLDPPMPIDGLDFPAPEGGENPRLAIDGRNRGMAAGSRDRSLTPTAALSRDDRFAGGQLMSNLINGGTSPDTVISSGENLQGVVAWKESPPESPAGVVVKARFEADNAFETEFQVSQDALGAVVPQGGLSSAADDQGNSMVAFVQGSPEGRRIVAGLYDKPPGRSRGLTRRVVNTNQPRLRWSEAAEQFGPVTYTVYLDGRQVGEFVDRVSMPSPGPLSEGKHRYRVDTRDIRGQRRQGRDREIEVKTQPSAALKRKRAQRR